MKGMDVNKMKSKEKLYKISCDPECGFAVQSHDEHEVVGIVKEHAAKAHKMTVTENDVKMKMQSMS